MRKKSIQIRVFVVLLLASLVAYLLLCDPFKTRLTETDVESYIANNFSESEIPDTLKIMTWNIKFGGGRIDFFFDCYGDRVIMEEKEVFENLQNLSQKINQYKPDILFLQEVDVDSKRSAFVNQMQWLLDNTDLNYGVYASQWKAIYIPSDGIGRINSGNAILSKWKMENSKRIALPLFEDQNFIVRYFYLKRNILTTELNIGNEKLQLINTHLSAYSKDGTKKKQIDIVDNLLEDYNNKNEVFIIGGDFNSLPPNSKKINNFPDAVCEDEDFSADDYSEETQWMIPFYRFSPAINLEIYNLDNAPYFSHTTKS